jgi:transcriptional regulator with XRE-family HTH domain
MCFVNTDAGGGKGAPSWEATQAARIGQAVQNLRGKRTAAWLAKRVEELGLKMTRQTIADLENGRRRYVTTAEITVLAAALNTNPVALAYPEPYEDDGELVEVLPQTPVPKLRAAQWFSGLTSLPLTDVDDRREYERNTRPLRDARKIWNLEKSLAELVIPKEEGALRELALEQAASMQRELATRKEAHGA